MCKDIKKEVNNMAVSKAILSCVTGEAGIRLINDIKKSKINLDAKNKCDQLLEKLKKGEFEK